MVIFKTINASTYFSFLVHYGKVSSFSTSGSRLGFNNYITKPSNLNEPDYIRWMNCSQRDFTINRLHTKMSCSLFVVFIFLLHTNISFFFLLSSFSFVNKKMEL